MYSKGPVFTPEMPSLGSVVQQAGGGRQPPGQRDWGLQKSNVYSLQQDHIQVVWGAGGDGGAAGPRPVHTYPICQLEAGGHNQGRT